MALGSRAGAGAELLSSSPPSETPLLGWRVTCVRVPEDVSKSLGTQTSASRSQGRGPTSWGLRCTPKFERGSSLSMRPHRPECVPLGTRRKEAETWRHGCKPAP